ncbi:CAP domain-containing protein [Reichenbachiella ulvae]|uniref:CAP domain-containing protein n=1 Tax=Reichenbachiella ulvae TaxID=2980104 RepID=A0ABT3D1L4_9BACT|nr:CAP domain-containing protein [Reichenbachiella ulvae]MCV9389338.1 CAP domain-containing protein [Reichenbachiella ulvae]
MNSSYMTCLKTFKLQKTPLKWALPVLLLSFILLSCDDGDEKSEEEVADEAYIQELLDQHNTYRSDVGVSDIQWSEELAQSAQAWADELAKTCVLAHSSTENGENIWKGTSGFFTAKDVVNTWGSENSFYNYSDNSCDDGQDCGHYTQIIWAKSTELGCGMSTCDGNDIWVCQYSPAGNVIGEKPY